MGRGAYIVDEAGNQVEKKSSKGNSFYKWDEIKNTENQWIVINDNVYDVSQFMKKHPGGRRIIYESLNQDVTDAFQAFHKDMPKVSKYMKVYEIGKLSPSDKLVNPYETDKDLIQKDFRAIRELAEKMDLFKTNVLFFFLHFAHIVMFELLGWAIIAYSGYNNWFTYMLGVFCLVTAQAQAGWSQHDYGHLSVFKTSKMNHFFHRILIGFIKVYFYFIFKINDLYSKLKFI
jgi:fatty acid desaturase 2 (delta-6 desaturase)